MAHLCIREFIPCLGSYNVFDYTQGLLLELESLLSHAEVLVINKSLLLDAAVAATQFLLQAFDNYLWIIS